MENGAGKISLTREELVELLSQAVNGNGPSITVFI